MTHVCVSLNWVHSDKKKNCTEYLSLREQALKIFENIAIFCSSRFPLRYFQYLSKQFFFFFFFWLLLMIFLSLEFTGVTNSAVIWENSSQLVSIHLHLHYYYCNLPSFSHFLSHSTCYQAMGFLSFGHTTLSILFRAWQLCNSLCSCSPVIEMLWYGREEAPCTLYRLLTCPLLIQRLDHAFLSS